MEIDEVIAEKYASYLAAVKKLEAPASRWSPRWLRGQQDKLKAAYKSKGDLDFRIGNKPGTYQIRTVDMAKDNPNWVRVHFIYPIADVKYTATLYSTFIRAGTDLELGVPTLKISENDHPLLNVGPNHLVRVFNSFNKDDYYPHPLSLNGSEQILGAHCLAD